MLKAIIIDDEHLAIETLSLLLKKYCTNVELLGSASNALEGIKLINHKKPDLVFLDIDMPGGTGFDLLEAFASRWFKVIFTTASSDYAIKAIKAHAADYLLKPIDVDELEAAIAKLKSMNNATEMYNVENINKIALPCTDGVQLFEINKIVRLEANDNYTWFYIDGLKNKFLVSKTLKEFEDEFVKKYFFRIHQTHIINLNYLDKYIKGRGGYVIMKDGTNLDVSSRRKDEFLKRINYR